MLDSPSSSVRHTNAGFVTPKAAKTTRSVKSMLRLTTIVREPGEKIGMTIHAGSKGVQVLALDPNGPSARTGTIHVLDMIVEINGKPTYGMSPSDVTKFIKELGNKSFTVRTYRSSSLITPHTTPRSAKTDLTPVHPTPHHTGNRQGRRLVFSPDGKTSSYATHHHSDNNSGIVMQPLHPTDMCSPASSPQATRRSISPVIFGEDGDLDEFKQLEQSLVGAASSRKLLSKSKSVTQPETDSHFAQLRHLARTDYSQYSRVVLNQDQTASSASTGTISKPTSPNRPRSFPHITSTFEQFRLDADNDVSKWLQRYEPKAESRRCGPCQSNATEHATNTNTTNTCSTTLLILPSPCRSRSGSISRRSSSIPISRSRSDSLTKSKALALSLSTRVQQPANTSDTSFGGADGTTTSFQLFKYKVLLTQLDAARARRADGMDDLERTRVEICTFIEKLFGQSSDQVNQLSAASSAADPSTEFDQGGICESSIPLPNHRGATSKEQLDLGTKHSADILCKAVLLQLSHVEKARTKSARAKDDLILLRRKALITARGVRARVVRLWARGGGDNLGLSLFQGVCHTSRGVTISAISPESPASTCGSVFAGDVILKINHKCMLSCTKTEVNSMLSCPSGYLTLVLAPSAELDAALALRWYAGDTANCCEHELATNRWLYQQTPTISRKALEEIDRNNVLQLQQQHLGDSSCPQHQLPAPETVSGSWDLKSQPSASHLNMDRATFFPPRDTATVTSDVGAALLNGTARSSSNNSQQLESLLTKVPCQTKTDAMTKMLDTIGISHSTPTSTNTIASAIIPPPSDEGEAVQYAWQSSPTPIESMEQRRKDLLEMDISENDALMNEWMMLLRVRATVQNGQESEHASPSSNNEIQKPSMRSRFASLIGNFTSKSKAFATKRIQSSLTNTSISETSELDLTDDNTSSSSSVTITLDDDVLSPIKHVDYVNPSDDHMFSSHTYNQPTKGLRVDAFGNWEPPTMMMMDDNVSDCDSAHNYSLDADSCTTTSDIADLAIEPVLSTTQLQEIEARARRRAIATRKVFLRQQQLQKAAKQAQETPIAGLQRKGSAGGKKSKEVLAKDFSRRMAMMKTLKDSLNGGGGGGELVPDVEEQPALRV